MLYYRACQSVRKFSSLSCTLNRRTIIAIEQKLFISSDIWPSVCPISRAELCHVPMYSVRQIHSHPVSNSKPQAIKFGPFRPKHVEASAKPKVSDQKASEEDATKSESFDSGEYLVATSTILLIFLMYGHYLFRVYFKYEAHLEMYQSGPVIPDDRVYSLLSEVCTDFDLDVAKVHDVVELYSTDHMEPLVYGSGSLLYHKDVHIWGTKCLLGYPAFWNADFVVENFCQRANIYDAETVNWLTPLTTGDDGMSVESLAEIREQFADACSLSDEAMKYALAANLMHALNFDLVKTGVITIPVLTLSFVQILILLWRFGWKRKQYNRTNCIFVFAFQVLAAFLMAMVYDQDTRNQSYLDTLERMINSSRSEDYIKGAVEYHQKQKMRGLILRSINPDGEDSFDEDGQVYAINETIIPFTMEKGVVAFVASLTNMSAAES